MDPKKVLLVTAVVGTQFYEGIKNLDLFPLGSFVRLVPEPENPYDPQAIAVYSNHPAPVKLGHIPKKTVGYAQIISVLLSNGVSLTACVCEVRKTGRDPVSIAVALV